MAVKGIDIVVQVNTGTDSSPSWTTIGGQQGGSLNLETDDIDVTDKDGSGWTERLAGIRDWSIDFDGLHSDTDSGLQELFDEYMNHNQVNVRFQMANGDVYEGDANISDLTVDAPHDDAATASGTLNAAGKLQKNP